MEERLGLDDGRSDAERYSDVIKKDDVVENNITFKFNLDSEPVDIEALDKSRTNFNFNTSATDFVPAPIRIPVQVLFSPHQYPPQYGPYTPYPPPIQNFTPGYRTNDTQQVPIHYTVSGHNPHVPY